MTNPFVERQREIEGVSNGLYIEEKVDGLTTDITETNNELSLPTASLRPTTLEEYIGQSRVKSLVSAIVQASATRNAPLPHILIQGPAGHGKTSLVRVIANIRGVELDTVLAPSIESRDDLARPLLTGSLNHIFFIDEIHRLRARDQESLYSAMEDFVMTETVGSGVYAETSQRDIAPFSLIAATTNPGSLSKPLLDRFRLVLRLREYTTDELMELVALKSDKMKVQIEDTSVRMIADRCRFNPRHAENILRTCSDFMSVLSEDRITISVAEETLVNLGIDSLGLTEDDRKILFTIAETFNGGPIGVDSIALASNVDKDTVTDTVEPLLLRHGLIERQPRGRKITKEGLEHLVIVGAEQSELL